jgi:hypothetical protein
MHTATIPPPEFEMKSHPQSAQPGDGKAVRRELAGESFEDISICQGNGGCPKSNGVLGFGGFGVFPISGHIFRLGDT